VNISFTMHKFFKMGSTFVFFGIIYVILNDDKLRQAQKECICTKCGYNRVI